ncbi:MAG: flotillin domain-containing protein [Burkholderiaceae bacterium]
MTATVIGSLILWLIVLIIIIAVAVYLLRWLYRRPTKEMAFVRTGFLGQKVAINGGAFVVPVLHEVTPVPMTTSRIDVRRQEQHALITKNRMRVDVAAEFFVRVRPNEESVALAAQTLGRRAMQPDVMHELLTGKFTSALRSVAATMTLEEMHERRNDYMGQVTEQAGATLELNGLELESVALSDLDQTSTEFFDPTNVFDAEGLTQLTETIESRRRQRNDVEQQTLVEIRHRNLEAEQQVLQIDREGEYARIEQEREIQIRRAVQQSELARERALREQEAEQAQLAAKEEVEKSRITYERALAETRISNEEETQRREIARRKAIDEAEVRSQQEIESERIAVELTLERERIARTQEQERLEIERRKANEVAEREREITLVNKAMDVTAANASAKKAELDADLQVNQARIDQERQLDQARIAREQQLQALEIAKRQSFEASEIQANEEVEQARIATDRALQQARIELEKELKTLTIDQQKAIELAEMDKSIELTERSRLRSAATAAAESDRAKAIEAEEKTFTAREREIAERRKMLELIAASQEVEREGLKITARAEAEREAATSHAEMQRVEAQAKADTEKVLAEVAQIRYAIDAEGNRNLNEAENLLSEPARMSQLRKKLLDKLEGIVRESVRPMEKINGINILHVDGINGNEGGGDGSVTDEVINSALRYRVQAPMIDSLMKDIGVDGGKLGNMADVFRNARDIDALSRGKEKSSKSSSEPKAEGGTATPPADKT